MPISRNAVAINKPQTKTDGLLSIIYTKVSHKNADPQPGGQPGDFPPPRNFQKHI